MSSALTHEQCDLLRKVAAGRRKRAVAELSDLALLLRAGLIVKARADMRFRITEAGKRYVAFIEHPRLSPGDSLIPLRPFDRPNTLEKPGSL